MIITLLVGLAAANPLPFQFEGWPGEGVPTFTATSPISTPLRPEAKPDSPEMARCELQPGQPLPFSMSTQVVTTPLPLTISTALTLRATSYGRLVLLTHTAYYGAGTEKTVRLQPGDEIEYLMPRAEGFCFFRKSGEVFTADCMDLPIPAQSIPTSSWWIQATCGDEGGWLHLDPIMGSLNQERGF
jgi:hypothetical protein